MQISPPAPVPLNPSGVAGLAIAAGLCFLGPILAGVWWHRRRGASWRVFAAGSLVFFVAQVVLRFPWQIPLAHWVYRHPAWLLPFLFGSSFTAGVFEECGRWLGYRYLVRERSLRQGVMYGLGHGGLEAILLGGLPLGGLLVSWIAAAQGYAPEPVVEAVRQRTATIGLWSVQLATVERASAMVLHVGLALIVLQAWTRGGFHWLILAIGLHFGMNALATWLIYARRVDPTLVEPLVAVLALAVLVTGWRLASGSAAAGPALPEAS